MKRTIAAIVAALTTAVAIAVAAGPSASADGNPPPPDCLEDPTQLHCYEGDEPWEW